MSRHSRSPSLLAIGLAILAAACGSQYSKIALASSTRVRHARRPRSSTCIRLQNDSIIALVVTAPDRAHRGQQPGVDSPPGERPGRELAALV